MAGSKVEHPIFTVRQSTKRKPVTEPLEVAEFRALILELPDKMRVIGIVAATTGLRISEVLGLKWMDIDWKTLQMDVTRSVVDGIVGKCKTETSRGPVPIDELTTAGLLAWRRETCYAEPEDWVLASERVHGKMPPWAAYASGPLPAPAAKRAESRIGSASIPSDTPTQRCSKRTEKMSKWCRN